ncbi:MAG: diaminopimelate decarboxylase [Campylobacter sp.]|nr:diaminopimelate decarboxylase [Campylobacter sp.]
MNYKNLLDKYGSPLYLYDLDYISRRYKDIKDEFHARKSLVCYAIKANSNLSIIKHLANLGSGFDCVSFNEVKRALIAGAKPYKIIFSGVGKRDDEIKDTLEAGILMINLESSAELKRVEAIAKSLDKVANISIRVNPNINPKTHPYISTGLKDNKFGVEISEAKKMYIEAKNSPNLNPIGIHFHIGSQLIDIKPIFEAAKIVSNLVRELKAIDIDIKFFDVGGGIGIKYKDEIEPSLYEYAQGILDALSGQDLTIICEFGRYLVGNSGTLLTKVLYEKTNNDKRFVIIDAAMNDLLRPSLYGSYHEISLVQSEQNGKQNSTSPCDVVGPVCESGDFLGKSVELPPLKSGDILAVKSVGAYGFAMSSNYNSRQRPAEVALQDGKDRLIRKKESFEDLISLEKEFL